MKIKKSFLSCLVIVAALLFGLLAPAWSTVPTLDLVPNDSAVYSATKKLEFNRGSDFYLNVVVNNTTDIAGAAFTITYDTEILEPPTIDATGLSDGITSPIFTTFTDARVTPNVTETVRRGSMASGKILLSGAMINATTGGALTNPDGNGILFRLKFRVKTDAPFRAFNVGLTATTLNNTAAGYAEGGEAIPLLVGALVKTDANYENLTVAFPVLLASLAQPLSLTCNSVELQQKIQGTISYTGKQAGTLNVGAFLDSNLTQFVAGSGYAIAWPGTGTQAYTLALAAAGNYYVGAYIDSLMPDGSAANNQKDTWEAQGQYDSVIAVATNQTVTGKDFAMADPDTGGVGLPDWWRLKYGIGSTSTEKLASLNSTTADYDKDGYANLVEYQGYKADGSGMNPTTVQEAPGATGYNAATDDRNYSIAGTVSYSGSNTGTLYVAAYAASDTSFTTPVATQQYTWETGRTSQVYVLNLANATYVVRAFIGASSTLQATDPQGTSAQVVLAGINQTGKDITLIVEPAHKIFFQGPNSMNKNSSGKFILITEIPAGKTLKAFNVQVNYDSTKLALATTNGVVASTSCPSALVPTNTNTSTAGQVLFNGFNTTGVAGEATINWLEFTLNGKGVEGDTQLSITVNSYGASTTDQFKPKVQNFNLQLVSFPRGDADGSGTVDIFDALIVAEYDAQLKTAQELPGFAVADVDNSGSVDIFDALKIAEFDAGLIPNLD